MFDKLRRHLESKVAAFSSPYVLNDLATELKYNVLIEAVQSSSGLSTGIMEKNLEYASQPELVMGGYRVGIGKEVPPESAPGSTIAAFLKRYPQFRRRRNGKKPWQALPQEGKEVLDLERRMGLFGGTVGKSLYWTAQEHGDRKAGIRSRGFISKALRRFPAMVHRRIRETLK